MVYDKLFQWSEPQTTMYNLFLFKIMYSIRQKQYKDIRCEYTSVQKGIIMPSLQVNQLSSYFLNQLVFGIPTSFH